MATETIKAPAPPVGVIESLSRGFETVAAYPALLILPLLLDVVLLVGPRVSFAPAVDTFVEDTNRELQQQQADAQTISQWEELGNVLRENLGNVLRENLGDANDQYFPARVVPTNFGQVVDLILILSDVRSSLVQARVQSLPLIGVPNTFAARKAAELPFGYRPPVWTIASMPGVLGILLLGQALQLVLGSVYLLLVANQIAGKRLSFAAMARLPVIILQVMILGVVLKILLLIVLTPFIVLAGGSALISGFLADMILIIGLLVGLWANLFVVFPVHGMLLNKRNLLGALWDSFRVVQWNMSSSMMLMLLVAGLNLALGYLWTLSDPGSWIALLAAGGNAFFSTGLIAATFVFYQDRYRYWREMREALLAELQRRRAQDHTGV
jgi:hypothetical protein